MSKFWFRKNHQSVSPARLAEAQNLVTRQEAYDRAKDATIHLLTALKQWPGFDSTGNINGAIDHTLVNIDRLDDALDELRDQIDKLRGQQVAEMVQRSGHPATQGVNDKLSIFESAIVVRPKPPGGMFQVPLKASMGAPGDVPQGDQQ
ncbi:hypothetical protein ACTXL8_14645 [Glutamicibacter arilaitensis]|uniref:hypothetical protein n=1 Tax=Glutamicibacter arilaitensis TaxID=256701 RepID=UPI003FCF46B3